MSFSWSFVLVSETLRVLECPSFSPPIFARRVRRAGAAAALRHDGHRPMQTQPTSPPLKDLNAENMDGVETESGRDSWFDQALDDDPRFLETARPHPDSIGMSQAALSTQVPSNYDEEEEQAGGLFPEEGGEEEQTESTASVAWLACALSGEPHLVASLGTLRAFSDEAGAALRRMLESISSQIHRLDEHEDEIRTALTAEYDRVAGLLVLVMKSL